MSDDIQAQVTFMVKPGTEEALLFKAREIDLEVNEQDDGIDYTIAQALQVVWHVDPEWVHESVLEGWTFDKVCDDHGWHTVWPEKGN